MSTKTLDAHHDEHHHDSSSKTVLGFWVYLMSDLLLFASLFATYVVLSHGIADGPSGKDIFSLPYVLVETFILLFSSITFGMAMLATHKNQKSKTLFWLSITFLFGLAFIGMELHEFSELIHQGFGPNRSGFLSAFFTLVGTHGLHVTFGLLWIAILMIQIIFKGLTSKVTTRLMCLSLFWHFLDVVWICVFTIVYLIGVMK